MFVLSLSGTLNERTAEDPLASLTGEVSENIGLDKLLNAIKKAKDKEEIKGIYIEAGLFSSDTPASTHAIREALLDFKKSGKWIVAYADTYEQSTYYICSVADKIARTGLDAVFRKGPSGQVWREISALQGGQIQERTRNDDCRRHERAQP